ncbi:glycoside hydrolase family 2 protein, partial [Rhizobium johnstonii]|uniref:glycoside hydrolase family 2 protein n=1 Tax=Rhizobium johnstonii TaxID=3019933 RepID=UPI003F9604A8
AWRITASTGTGCEGHNDNGTNKALELEPAGLTVTNEYVEENGSVDINVTAKGLALFVMIETETDVKYSDNAFDLAAGESRRIAFTPPRSSGRAG